MKKTEKVIVALSIACLFASCLGVFSAIIKIPRIIVTICAYSSIVFIVSIIIIKLLSRKKVENIDTSMSPFKEKIAIIASILLMCSTGLAMLILFVDIFVLHLKHFDYMPFIFIAFISVIYIVYRVKSPGRRFVERKSKIDEAEKIIEEIEKTTNNVRISCDQERINISKNRVEIERKYYIKSISLSSVICIITYAFSILLIFSAIFLSLMNNNTTAVLSIIAAVITLSNSKLEKIFNKKVKKHKNSYNTSILLFNELIHEIKKENEENENNEKDAFNAATK